jgi:type IV secretion system protein VirB9
MSARPLLLSLAAAGLLNCPVSAQPDARLRELTFDPSAVVTVPVRRGVVTHVMLDADEGVSEVAAGMGGDCAKPDATWCIAAQPGSRHLFVKPKSAARGANNVAVVTDRRTHAFRFVVLGDRTGGEPVLRLAITASKRPQPGASEDSATKTIARRLMIAAAPRNFSYSIAEGAASEDIVPSLVFDDGRFTYLRFAGNREVPAVFHVHQDGEESVVNARMEGDLLVVDRVSRRLALRSGSAVVAVWNDAFEVHGEVPALGTTVPGVARELKTSEGTAR